MKTLLRRILNIYNRYRSAKWGGYGILCMDLKRQR